MADEDAIRRDLTELATQFNILAVQLTDPILDSTAAVSADAGAAAEADRLKKARTGPRAETAKQAMKDAARRIEAEMSNPQTVALKADIDAWVAANPGEDP